MAFSQQDVEQLTAGGASILGSDGDRIGELIQLYTSDKTGEPAWVTVKTGQSGSQESFVPLEGASSSGKNLTVSFDKETIKNAPRVDAGHHLSVEEEEELHRYYSGSLDGGQQPDTTTDARTNETTDASNEADGSDQARTDRNDQSRAESLAPGTAAGADGRSQETSTDSDSHPSRDTQTTDRSSDGPVVLDRKQPGANPDENGPGQDVPRRRADVEEPDSIREPAVIDSEHEQDPKADDRSDDRDVDRSAEPNSSTGHASDEGSEQDLSAGERITHEKRYIVTERVVQSVEEIPEDNSR